MQKTEWLKNRLLYIKGLKSPNEQQRMMGELAERNELSSKEQRTLNLLIRAAKTAERALKAKADVRSKGIECRATGTTQKTQPRAL